MNKKILFVVLVLCLFVLYKIVNHVSISIDNMANQKSRDSNKSVSALENNLSLPNIEKLVDTVNLDNPFERVSSIPETVIPAWGNNYGLMDDLDDGANGNMKLDNNLCSPSCCSQQYPTPHKIKTDPLVCGREDDFVPTNYYCSNSWNDSGCLCASKEQVNFLATRGGNTK